MNFKLSDEDTFTKGQEVYFAEITPDKVSLNKVNVIGFADVKTPSEMVIVQSKEDVRCVSKYSLYESLGEVNIRYRGMIEGCSRMIGWYEEMLRLVEERS